MINNIKIDARTGKRYTSTNIPIDYVDNNPYITTHGKQYKILAEAGNNDVWYNGVFLGDRYAVFVKTEAGFYQQLSNWYCRYGNAVNKLYSILKKEA